MTESYNKYWIIKNLEKLLELHKSGDPENELDEKTIEEYEATIDRLSE